MMRLFTIVCKTVWLTQEHECKISKRQVKKRETNLLHVIFISLGNSCSQENEKRNGCEQGIDAQSGKEKESQRTQSTFYEEEKV